MNNPVFHIDLLKHYQVLDRPGTFIVSVAYDITEENLYLKDEYPRYLVPLRVIRGDKLPQLIKLLKERNQSFYNIKHYFLTGAIFDNDEFDPILLPAKGEQIIATFDEVDNKLQCTHIKLIDRNDLLYVNFDAIDDLYALAKKFLSK